MDIIKTLKSFFSHSYAIKKDEKTFFSEIKNSFTKKDGQLIYAGKLLENAYKKFCNGNRVFHSRT